MDEEIRFGIGNAGSLAGSVVRLEMFSWRSVKMDSGMATPSKKSSSDEWREAPLSTQISGKGDLNRH